MSTLSSNKSSTLYVQVQRQLKKLGVTDILHLLSQIQQSPRTLVAVLTRLIRELANSYQYPPRSFPLETDGNGTVRLRSPTSPTAHQHEQFKWQLHSWQLVQLTGHLSELDLPRSYSHPVSTLVPSPLPRFYLSDISQASSQILSLNCFLHDCGRRPETTL